MMIRPLGIALLAGAALLLFAPGASAQSNGDDDLLRTPDGHPDIGGLWDFRTVTPLERPEQFADKEFLTEEEAAAYEQERVLANNADLNREDTTTDRGLVNGTRESADLRLAYNDFWWDRGTTAVETRRTSLVVDPPNGRLPSLTEAAEQRRADDERLAAQLERFSRQLS